jgi:hypothetical protein
MNRCNHDAVRKTKTKPMDSLYRMTSWIKQYQDRQERSNMDLKDTETTISALNRLTHVSFPSQDHDEIQISHRAGLPDCGKVKTPYFRRKSSLKRRSSVHIVNKHKK